MTWAKAAIIAALGAAAGAGAMGMLTAERGGEIVAHCVYFALKDPSQANVDKFIDESKKHAAKHEGMILFACGERLKRSVVPISDKEFHVAQLFVFNSREAFEKYHKSEERRAFVANGRPTWSKIRVFELDLRGLETRGLKRSD